MTVICGVRHKNKYILACDSRATEDTLVVSDNFNKIVKDFYTHSACSGDVGDFNRFLSILNKPESNIFEHKARGKDDETDAGLDALVVHIDSEGYCYDVLIYSVTKQGTEVYSALNTGFNGDIVVLGSGATVFLSMWRYLTKRGQPTSYQGTIKVLKECFAHTASLMMCCNNNIQIITYDIQQEGDY